MVSGAFPGQYPDQYQERDPDGLQVIIGSASGRHQSALQTNVTPYNPHPPKAQKRPGPHLQRLLPPYAGEPRLSTAFSPLRPSAVSCPPYTLSPWRHGSSYSYPDDSSSPHTSGHTHGRLLCRAPDTYPRLRPSLPPARSR